MFRTIRRVLLTLIAVLLVAVVVIGGYIFIKFRGIWGDPSAILADIFEDANIDFGKTVTYNGEKYVYNKDIVSLLLIGLDEDEGRTSARSDMMAVVAIDTAGQTAKIIVCPRDTRAEIRHTDDNGNATSNQMGKLNSAFPYGGGNKNKERGGENVLYNVSRVLSCGGKYDLPLTKFGGINMQGIGPLTDAVGGVTITLPQTMQGIGSAGETVKLNGDQAARYCTARKGVGDGSDISRGQRQMVYMMALMMEVKNMEAGEILSVYSAVNKYAFTNMSTDEMVAYAATLKNVPATGMQTLQLQGSGKTIEGQSYYILDDASLEKMVIETFYKKK